MITGIGTVSIYVQDQQEALKFWAEKVGFEVRANNLMTPQSRWIEVAPRDGQTALVLYPKSMMPDWNERKPSVLFTCEEIEKTYSELASRGVDFKQEPKKMPGGTYAIFLDVDGNEFIIRG